VQERVSRYEEEIGLVVEEMRRTLAFFKWLACEWEKRATFQSEDMDKTTNRGISAYAYKQATIYRKLVDIFIGDWYWCLKQRSLGLSWLKEYPAPPPNKRLRLASNVQLYHSTGVPSDPPYEDSNDLEVIPDNDIIELTDDY
jgi:hypothetical protein